MKSYEEAKKDYIDHFGKPKKRSTIVFFVTVIFMIVTIFFSFVNMNRMKTASSQYVKDYVTDITYQMAETVNTSQSDMKNIVAGIDESIQMFTEDGVYETGLDTYIQSYLDKVNDSVKFDYLVFLKTDGSLITSGKVPQDVQDRMNNDMQIVQEVNTNGGLAAFIANDDVYYASSVFSYNTHIGTIIAGINTDSLSNIINNKVYEDRTVFCITNLEGKILIKSYTKTFTKLGIEVTDNEDIKQAIVQDFSKQRSGMVEVEIDDEKYYLSYAPVKGEDWMLLTLIEDNAFSSIYISYMTNALIITVVSAIIFVILFVLLVYSTAKNRKTLETIAFKDDLTDGNNTVEFKLRYERLQQTSDPTQYSIVMMDIRDFKLINEAMGFTVGDMVLKDVYNAIQNELNEEDNEFVSRCEMDHYIICMKENTNESVQNRIDTIVDKINIDTNGKDNIYQLAFKSGAVIVKDSNTTISELEECARVARQNLNPDNPNACSFYTDEMHQKIYDNRMLDRMAGEGITNHEFKVYYQPKVSLHSNTIKGAEALVRWQHPKYGLISPDKFIPVLEDTGRIQELDKYVFEEVCRFLDERQSKGKLMFPISINLSRRHFWKNDFLSEYLDILSKYNVDRKYIVFEITETVFIEAEKHKRIKEGIDEMHSNGFTCSVDDFGTGYSSLSLVRDMDVDELKFDKSFFDNIEDKKAQSIIKILIDMAKELQLSTVIEGIETQEQINFLKDQSCDVIQGYFYSPPLPEDKFNEWVEQFNK